MWNPFIKYLPHLVVTVLIVLILAVVHHGIKQDGFREGAASVQAEWDKDTQKYLEEISRIQGEIQAKEEIHRTENRKITHELAEANRTHAVEIATMQYDFDRRMQLSSNRSAIYQRQAEAGTLECRSLASHASRLDAALEEGRAVEREYRSTLGLRDRQIKALSDQIRNDRTLMEE